MGSWQGSMGSWQGSKGLGMTVAVAGMPTVE